MKTLQFTEKEAKQLIDIIKYGILNGYVDQSHYDSIDHIKNIELTIDDFKTIIEKLNVHINKN